MIRIEQLKKSYGKNEVLKGIDLQIDQPGIYGIVGPNGAGKTTFYRCLLNLESFEGTINMLDDLKNAQGYLETTPFFFQRMTGREYLRLIANARNITIEDWGRWNIFDLPLEEYAANYSTGMKKKLAFSAILFQENKVLVLDEPFNGVDIQSNMIISDIIRKWKSLGKLVFISSHIFSTMKDLCDEILYLKDGKLEDRYLDGSFDELEETMKLFILGDRLVNLRLK